MDEKFVDEGKLITGEFPVAKTPGVEGLVEVELYPGVSVTLRPEQMQSFEASLVTRRSVGSQRRVTALNKARKAAENK